MVIKPLLPSYHLGNVISCSADGNPPPTVHWKNFVTGNVTHGSELAVVKSFSNFQTLSFQCIASNKVDKKLASAAMNISFTINTAIDDPLLHYKGMHILTSSSRACLFQLPLFYIGWHA